MDIVVFDIETISVPMDSLGEEEWKYLTKYAESEEEEEKTKERMSLWAFTANLVSLSMLAPSEGKAIVLYVADRDSTEEFEDKGVEVYMKSYSIDGGIERAERQILEVFWKKVEERRSHKFVSFNGRSFDAVFLNLRSFILGVEVTRNLLGNRYNYDNHVDLLDLLTFHGVGRKYSLDFICRRMKLKSPKEDMDGKEIKDWFEKGKYRDIAIYNLRDVMATAELYKRFYNTFGKAFGL